MFNFIIYVVFIANFLAASFVEGEEFSKPFLYNLNDLYTHPISTKLPLAQKYFDQGMIFFYGYNFDESDRAFQEATRLDPDCAICYWGRALALRANVENLKDHHLVLAMENAKKAKDLILNASPQEQAYINALANSYIPNSRSLQDLDTAFMLYMKEVSDQYPEDLDAVTLYGKAQMDVIPFDQWDASRKIFLTVMEAAPSHPGANHFYIHAVDASAPTNGLESAKRLETIVPFAGHLMHMSAHIYFKTGQFHKATLATERANKADEDLFSKGGIKNRYFSGFYFHNLQYLIISLVMEEKEKEALQAAQRITDISKKENPAFAVYMKNVLPAQRVLILQRFNEWDQILREPKPETPFGNGMWHFARSLAYLSKNDLEKAKIEAAEIQDEKVDKEEDSLNSLLKVVFLNAQAAIFEREGNYAKMREDYKEAIRLEDTLTNFEPPVWFSSSRENLGFSLLRIGKSQEAEEVFKEDLEKHPNKPWSLRGVKG